MESGWPLELTLALSGRISVPLERSSSRSKSVSAKSANPAGQLRSRSAAEGWPLQLKLDSGQLWQGFHTADISKLMRRFEGATPTAVGPSADRNSVIRKTSETSRSEGEADQHYLAVLPCVVLQNAAMYARILGLLSSVLVSFFDDFWLQFGWFTPSWASLGPVGCSRGVPDAPKSDF